MMKTLILLKIGGNVVDDAATLGQVLDAVAGYEGPMILVHGGGKAATRLAERLGLEQQMVDGRRITDAATLDVAVMVYGGLLNKQIVAGLQARGCNALGLSGADGNSLRAVRRPPEPIDFGLVGDLEPEGVNASLLVTLLEQEVLPVFCALTHDGAGQLLNTNADTLAQSVAVALSGQYDVRLVYLFEKKGVLRDVDDQGSLIARIPIAEAETLIAEGVIHSGMIPKIRNAAAAVARGVASVSIGQPQYLHAILNEDPDACTRIVAD